MKTIELTKKVINVGKSWGNTLPQKDLKAMGVELGDEIRITIEPVAPVAKHDKLMQEYGEFVEQYGETLKNLSQR